MGRERVLWWTDLPHAVIPRASACSEYDRELGHVRACHSRDELRPILGDAALFRVSAHHEAADVLEKDERNAPLGAELDKMGAFEGRFGEEDAVVGENADLIPVDARES